MSNFIYDSNFNGPEGVPFIGEANKYHYVYLIVNHLNGKIYIGVHSTKKLNDRYIGSSKSVKNDIKEFGIKWFTKYNLFYFYTRKEAFTKEYELVDKEFCLRNDTYNIAIGGKGLYLAVVPYETRKKMSEANKGRKHTDETKKKMSETKKGHVVTDETKKKISEANKGRKLTDELKQKMSETRKGRKLTESTRKKMSESRKGRIVTEETRKKISKANKGRKMTDEMRRKKSEIMKGRVSGHKGHKHTDETKKKMSEAKKGKVTIVKNTF